MIARIGVRGTVVPSPALTPHQEALLPPPPTSYLHWVHLCHVHTALGVSCLLLGPLSIHLAELFPMRAATVPAWGWWWSLHVEGYSFR